MKTAILDADVIVHRACSFVEDNPMGTMWGIDVIQQTLNVCNEIIERWVEWSTCPDYMLAFTGEGENFRRKFMDQYKRNRTNPKPENYEEVRDLLYAEHDSFSFPTLEGDDVMGLFLTMGKADVAVSPDKDIYTIPGHVLRIPYDTNKVSPVLEHNSLVDANRYYMMQALSGDRVDGYYGAPGIGAVKSRELLKNADTIDEMWVIVRRTFIQQYNHKTWGKRAQLRIRPEEAALAMIRCAYILRNGSYNFEKQEVIPWTTQVSQQRQVDTLLSDKSEETTTEK